MSWRVIVALIVAALGLVTAGLTSVTPTAAAAPTCSDIEAIGIRGSGEWPQKPKEFEEAKQKPAVNSMGEKAAAPAYRAFADQVGMASVNPRALLYPAAPINMETLKPGEPRWGLPPYEDNLLKRSIVEGVSMLEKHVNKVEAQCPDTRFAVIAYSQGALVVQNYLDSPRVSTKTKAKLRVLLFGSPKFHADSSAAGAFNPLLGGMLWGKEIPAGVSARTYCTWKDPICNYTGLPGLAACEIGGEKYCSHHHYGRKDKLKLDELSYTQHGADWLASRFNASNITVKDVLTLDENGKEKQSFNCPDKKIRLAVILENNFGHTVQPVITFDSYEDKTSKPKLPNGTYTVSTPVDVPTKSGEYKLTVTVSYQGKTSTGEEHYFTYVCWQ